MPEPPNTVPVDIPACFLVLWLLCGYYVVTMAKVSWRGMSLSDLHFHIPVHH